MATGVISGNSFEVVTFPGFTAEQLLSLNATLLLIDNPNITKLKLHFNTDFPLGFIKTIGDALKRNGSITDLKMTMSVPRGERGFDAPVKMAIDVLSVNRTVTHFTMKAKDPHSDGVGYQGEALAKVLHDNSTVTHLNLGDNFLPPDSIKALLQNPHLKELKLDGISMLDPTIEYANNRAYYLPIFDHQFLEGIANQLGANQTLESFSFSFNDIGRHGIGYFADALVDNHTLRSLNLGANNVDPEGTSPTAFAEAVARLIRTNFSITELNLQHSGFDNKTGSIVVAALEENSTITSFLGLERDETTHIEDPAVHERAGAALARNRALVMIPSGIKV